MAVRVATHPAATRACYAAPSLAAPPAGGRGYAVTTSDGVVVPLTGADAQRAFDRDDENLAVADATRLCGGGDPLCSPWTIWR